MPFLSNLLRSVRGNRARPVLLICFPHSSEVHRRITGRWLSLMISAEKKDSAKKAQSSAKGRSLRGAMFNCSPVRACCGNEVVSEETNVNLAGIL